ncbi:MAG: hypothetical protein HKP27_14340 [Myxococcales bacterium]|nr:hypothetical protein [Myxococcales bacterium]
MAELGPAARNRFAAAVISSAIVAGVGLAHADPERADALLYDIVFALGYGHLGAAAWRATVRRGMPLASWRAVLLLAALLDGFVIYALALRAAPFLGLGLLFVSTWHSIENDRELPSLYRRGALPALRWALGPLAADAAWFAVALCAFHSAGAVEALGVASWPGSRAPVAGVQVFGGLCLVIARLHGGIGTKGGALAVVALALAPRIGAELRFAEAFALVTLYHIASWAIFVGERAFARTGFSGIAARAIAPHAVPLVILGALVVLPAAEPWRALLFSPGIYLFWTSLHVIHSAHQRRSIGGA